MGASVSLSSEKVCLLDLQANRLIGTVSAGWRRNGLFDRDAPFSRDQRLAFVNNPPDRSMSVIDIAAWMALSFINVIDLVFDFAYTPPITKMRGMANPVGRQDQQQLERNGYPAVINQNLKKQPSQK